MHSIAFGVFNAAIASDFSQAYGKRGIGAESSDTGLEERLTVMQNRSPGIQPGSAVLIVLHSPREKCWGVLAEVSQAGVFLRGLDLNSFDEWLRAVAHDEPSVGLGDLFFPMWRVERISRDEASGGIPSLREQVEQRAGRTVEEMIALSDNRAG